MVSCMEERAFGRREVGMLRWSRSLSVWSACCLLSSPHAGQHAPTHLTTCHNSFTCLTLYWTALTDPSSSSSSPCKILPIVLDLLWGFPCFQGLAQ
ncbi:hypothetical protein MUK42_32983 [Musa troglodytarum]|uniref:Uncharacterized protein n=1 Tax=Musa troglodytarum TaxID=320322 RepID=A0A9E7I6P7_9LILI|nr:hypothetical protein MUK42_32983 [Musa troglodytarum]